MRVSRCPEMPSFSASGLDSVFKQWRDLGINAIDLYTDVTFAKFNQLKQKYGLHRSNFLGFCESETMYKLIYPNCAALLPRYVHQWLGHDKIISRLYDKLQPIKTTALKQNRRGSWGERFLMRTGKMVWKRSTVVLLIPDIL